MEKITKIADPVLARAFIDHFESVKGSLAERIEAVDDPDGAYSASLLTQSLRKLESQAVLSGLTMLQPFFPAFATVLTSAALPEPNGSQNGAQQAADLLAQLFSAFTRVLGDYALCLAKADGDGDTPVTLRTDVEPARLAQLFGRIAELRAGWPEQPPETVEEPPEPSFTLAREVIEQLVLEGGELLRRLTLAVEAAGEDQPGTGSTESFSSIASILRALYGNTELALRSSASPPAEDHPLSRIRALLENMLAIADDDEADQRIAAEPGRGIFKQAAVSLGQLLGDLEENQDQTTIDIRELEDTLVELRNAPLPLPVPPASAGENDAAPRPKSSTDGAIGTESEEAHIRVKQDKMDQLTNLVSELVVAKNSLSHVRSLLSESTGAAGAIQALENSEKLFSRVIHDMDKTVMGMRMQRVSDLFQRFPRLVRDIAKKNGKLIKLSLQGGDTLMDNLILKTISDPLVHLVRNGCDHGIETPEERKKNGKSATGMLQLSAGNEGGRIVIEIHDDGKGIDGRKIKELAVRRALISQAEADAMDEKAAQKLIFAPGFSTAAEVTDISGRGVGMDVVRANTEQVGGEIEIDSQAGRSTRIRLLLPLTLSISKGLKVIASRQNFIFPLENVITMISTEPESIHSHADDMFLSLRDRTVSLLSLAGLLGLDGARGFMENERLSVVLLDLKGKTMGVVVDGILGIEEIVTKPMPGDLSRLPYYSGCCIMSDGSVVAVLNPVALFQAGRQNSH